MMVHIRGGAADMKAALIRRHIWLALAKEDIDDQHRRTLLGPLWLLVNYLAYVAVFTFIVRPDSGISGYAIYVALGLMIWLYFMELISQSVNLFVKEEGFIKGTPLPLSIYALRLTAQCILRASYSAIGCLAILFVTGLSPSLGWCWALVGVATIIASSPPIVILFAFLGAAFPDSRYIVANGMRIGMFLTPVFWVPRPDHSLRDIFYWYNPFTYYLEVARRPIVGDPSEFLFLGVCLTFAVLLWIVALAVLGKFRRQVPFLL